VLNVVKKQLSHGKIFKVKSLNSSVHKKQKMPKPFIFRQIIRNKELTGKKSQACLH